MEDQDTNQPYLLSKRKNEEGQDVIFFQMGDILTECVVPEGGIECNGKFWDADELLSILHGIRALGAPFICWMILLFVAAKLK